VPWYLTRYRALELGERHYCHVVMNIQVLD
jgi:hypothetical protein